MSELVSAAVLGVVEGLTEYIPVSSTGHLIIVGDLIGFKGPLADTFEIFIQLGAILAVPFLYWSRFKGFFALREGSIAGMKGWGGILRIGLACVPAFLLGALLHGYIKEHLFSSLTVAWALIGGGIVLLFIERVGKQSDTVSVDDISIRQAIGIGVFQCLSLWPGVSRSGATIVGGMLLGCSRTVAAEFSFLVAVPVMCAAVSYDMLKSAALIAREDLAVFGVGFLVSFVTAVLAIRVFMGLLQRFTLVPFGVYRILLGVAVLVWAL